MNTKDESLENELSLALVALYKGVEEAKSVAKAEGLELDRAVSLKLVKLFAGDERAALLEQKWPAEQALTHSTVNKAKTAIFHSKETYRKLIDFSLFNEKAKELFLQFATASNMAMARSAEATSNPIEIPEITYAINGSEENISIILRFKDDIPELLQQKDAYQASVNDEPIEVIKFTCYLTKNKVQLWVASNSGVTSSCSCAIGYDPETNDSVGIFFNKKQLTTHQSS
jgi:hypothetical protein